MTKIKVYKTLVRPVVTFGSETWTFTKKEENSLRSFERKIQRRIFVLVSDHQGWRIRSNNELLNLIEGQDVKFIKAQRLRWLGHVNKMPETRTPIKMLTGRLYNTRRKGIPKLRWMDGISKDLEIMGVRGWTNMVKDRVRWKVVVKETKTHPSVMPGFPDMNCPFQRTRSQQLIVHEAALKLLSSVEDAVPFSEEEDLDFRLREIFLWGTLFAPLPSSRLAAKAGPVRVFGIGVLGAGALAVLVPFGAWFSSYHIAIRFAQGLFTSLMLAGSEFQSLGRAIVKEDEYEEVRWDGSYVSCLEELQKSQRAIEASTVDYGRSGSVASSDGWRLGESRNLWCRDLRVKGCSRIQARELRTDAIDLRKRYFKREMEGSLRASSEFGAIAESLRLNHVLEEWS
ncbi:hypothetical protein ANN_14613 [Periplaneta americana]|uniref:Uncharacterized protein n=1 Tax=Periplaneta americana TaxID=6978 RepID=A0ABQ8SY07_PERAM|nr:hypothetical protein ANN_14613 [Periplaneta americana]